MSTHRSTEANSVGIGVWGLGRHAVNKLLPSISLANNIHLEAVATRDADVLAVQSAKWKCRANGSLEAMLDGPGIDAVMVATPIGCHFQDGLQVLNAGRHLWCEKAFTKTFDEATELAGLAAQKDLALCVSCPPLYGAQFECLEKLLRQGALGTVRAITARFGFPHSDQVKSRYDPAVGGGALLDMGFYPLVLAAALMNEQPRVCGAVRATETGRAVDTGGAALLQFSGGVTANIEWGYGRDYVNEFVILGENGSATAFPAFSKPDNHEPTVVLCRQNEEVSQSVRKYDPFTEMFKVFATTLTDRQRRQQYRDVAIVQQALLRDVANACDRSD